MANYDRGVRFREPHKILTYKAGEGKTFDVKNEISYNLLREDSSDKIIVVDINGDYTAFARGHGGEVVDFAKTFINPLDVIGCTNKADSTENVTDSMDFLISFAELVAGKRFDISCISRVCTSMYRDARTGKRFTLADFHEKLIGDGDFRSSDLSEMIMPYCIGMFSFFAHETNINSDNRLTVIDLSRMNERHMPIALWASLAYIWSVTVKNSSATRIYLEEFERYCKNPVLTDMISTFLRRSIADESGVVIGIVTDAENSGNVEDFS